MKPFRFFFAVSFGILLVFFLAKFVFAAFLMAAVLSLLFFFGRKIMHFFQRLSWENEGYYDGRERFLSGRSDWKVERLMNFPSNRNEAWSDYRVIKIQ